MTEVINKFLDNLPAILVGLTGLLVAWNDLRKKIDVATVAAKASVTETVKGNEKLDLVHDAVTAGPSEVVVVNSSAAPANIHEVKSDPEAANQDLRLQIAELTERLRLNGNLNRDKAGNLIGVTPDS